MPSRTNIAAAMLIACCAWFFGGIQPLMVGGLVNSGRVAPSDAGLIATVEYLAFAVGAMVGPFVFVRRLGWKVFVCGLATCVLNLLSLHVGSENILILERALAGTAVGLMLGSANLVITHSRHPDRMSGISLGVALAPQMIAALLLPMFAADTLLQTSFLLLGGIGVVAMAASLPFGTARVVPGSHDSAAIVWSPLLLALIAAVFMQALGVGVAWSYIERIGHQRGLSGAVIGFALASCLFFQMAGSFAAAAMSRHWTGRFVLIACALIEVALIIFVISNVTALVFIVVACGLGFLTTFVAPFALQEMVNLDASRRMAVLQMPILLIGLSVAPYAASFAITERDFTNTYWVGAAAAAIAALLYFPLVLRRASQTVQPTV